jgi:hypothetical protein
MKSMAEIDERVPKPTVSWTQIYITEDEVRVSSHRFCLRI